MIAVNGIGLVIQAVYMVLILAKSNTRVIKAAAVGPSLIIVFGSNPS